MFKAGISMTEIGEQIKGVGYDQVAKLLLEEFKEQKKRDRLQEKLNVRYTKMYYARESDIVRELSIRDKSHYSMNDLTGDELEILNHLEDGVNYPLPISFIEESEISDNQHIRNSVIKPIVPLAS